MVLNSPTNKVISLGPCSGHTKKNQASCRGICNRRPQLKARISGFIAAVVPTE